MFRLGEKAKRLVCVYEDMHCGCSHSLATICDGLSLDGFIHVCACGYCIYGMAVTLRDLLIS